MAHASDPWFCTFHALRIKGFAKADVIGEVTQLASAEVESHLFDLREREWATYREVRELWQLTPDGRDEHRVALAEDLGRAQIGEALQQPYREFLDLNDSFKSLCGRWQLRDGQPNDHSNSAYDQLVLRELARLNNDADPVIAAMGAALNRMAPYRQRLTESCNRALEGEAKMFTGVMCGSFHDVWMELHEDLILTQGIDRSMEGSF